MIKFNKSTLTELAGLGAGSAASAYVKQKVLVKEDGFRCWTYRSFIN